MPQSYIKRILDARIYDLAIETPLDKAPLMGEKTGNNVLLKREDLQPRTLRGGSRAGES